MIEVNHSIISPWKYTKDGQIIVLTNEEAIKLLQNQCYISIGSQDLLKIIDIHKDIIFMIAQSKDEPLLRIYSNHMSIHLQTLEVWMNTLTEKL